MTTEQLTQKTIEQAEIIAKNTADICEIFHRITTLEHAIEEHGRTVNAIHELALSVQKLSDKIDNIDTRLGLMEGDKRKKGFAIWQAIVCGLIGAGVTLIATAVFGG